MRRYAVVGVLAACWVAFRCGYHTAAHDTAILDTVHSIALAAAINQTHTYKIEQMLTSAVVREMVTRTRYRIISNGDDADAILKGIVLSTYTTPMTYDSKTGRAASVLVVISLDVSLTDKQGGVLYR